MSANKLVICEKPSQAQAYAAVLGAKKRQDGFIEGNDWIVSWCFGHLVELAAADAYGEHLKRWSLDTLPILPEHWQYAASKGKAKQLAVLRTLMNRADVDSIICATDAGREGELIFRLVYNHCKCKKPVQRLWISSMEDSAIREGFANLRPGAEYDNLYRAALCRSQADWLVGINATRLFSCLYGSTLNVGRVQSPTLALIVSREDAIQRFVSEPFYTPEIDCGGFTALSEKQKDAEATEAIRIAVDGRDARILSVEKVKKTTAPPKLFDLTTLQREANRLFGFTAQQTLDYAQSLYEKKLITYPRTDSRYITEDMRDTAAEYIGKRDFEPNLDAIINNAKVSDHHALLPTSECANVDQLDKISSGEDDILKLIAERLLCAVAPVHVYEAVTAVLECGGYDFTAKGRSVLQGGWKAIESAYRAALKNKPKDDSADNSEDDSALPALSKDQTFESVTASVKEGKTLPPRRYTEDTLLSAMETAGAEDMPEGVERKGLGTPATRAATIEKLVKSGFIQRQKKQLHPTIKGVNLIKVLPDTVKSAKLTAEWEQMLGEIESGRLSDLAFMDGIASLTKELVAAHHAPVPEYAALFAESTENNSVTKRDSIIGKCPRCGSGVTEVPKGFFCSSRECKFVLWKDNRFFGAKKKNLTKTTAAALLKEGRVFFSDLFSEKTGKTYAATILLEDTGDKTNFKLDFQKGRDSK